MTTEEKAIQYADLLMGAKTLEELASVSAQIKEDTQIDGEKDWLRTIWWSANKTLRTPKFTPEDVFNKSGLEALRQGKIKEAV